MAVKVKQGVRNYFYYKLGRPEILNRIGDNVVVFDFIRPESAELILQSQIQKICRNIKVEKNINLTLTDKAVDVLKKEIKTNLENGGRGIGNIVESYLVNPLSSYVFDHDLSYGDTIVITDITITDGRITLLVSEDTNTEKNCNLFRENNLTDSNNSSMCNVEIKSYKNDTLGDGDIKDCAYLSSVNSVDHSSQNSLDTDIPTIDNNRESSIFDELFPKPESKKIIKEETAENIDDYLKE